MSTILLIVVGGLLFLAILVVLWGIMVYNGLVTSRNRFKNAFSQIDVQLNRRNDLIPNLVESVKGYMTHEKDTLRQVIEARNRAVSAGQAAAANPGDAKAMHELAAAEQQLSGVMGRLFALSEAYPDLKANQNVLQLQEELTSTENRIAFARQAYNDSVTSYNTSREVFPNVFIANGCGFQPAELLQVENLAAKDPPKVSLQ